MRYLLQFRCPDCMTTRPMIPEGVLHWLRDHGRLVREEKPSNELLFEMARLQAQSKNCEECNRFGLLVEEPEQLRDEDWGGQRLCEGCKAPLDPDRLEIFPDTTVCASCQSAEERGENEEAEYCPRCGAVMHFRSSGSSYKAACGDCGYSGT